MDLIFGDWVKKLNEPDYIKSVNQRVAAITSNYTRGDIVKILSNDPMLVGDANDDLNKLLETVELTSKEYAMISQKEEVEKSGYMENIEKLRGTEFFVKLHIFNKFMIDLYNDVGRIDEYHKNSFSRNSDCRTFVKDYLDRIKKMNALKDFLINSKPMREKYRIKCDDILTDNEWAFIRYMEQRLEQIAE